jgi:hypothetical protein
VDELLKLAIDGHGGWPRWQGISRFRAAASITGTIWTLKRKPGLLDAVVMEGETRNQRLTIAPFPRLGCLATWEPQRQTIETTEGVVLAERRDPAAAFVGATRESPWDELQVAYFASEGNWNYVVAPFLFTRGDFVTEETRPWLEDGQVWRTLLVTYPDTVVGTAGSRPTTSTTPVCCGAWTTPSTSWAAAPRCTTRRGTGSSTGSRSRPVAGSTSATPMASRS